MSGRIAIKRMKAREILVYTYKIKNIHIYIYVYIIYIYVRKKPPLLGEEG